VLWLRVQQLLAARMSQGVELTSQQQQQQQQQQKQQQQGVHCLMGLLQNLCRPKEAPPPQWGSRVFLAAAAGAERLQGTSPSPAQALWQLPWLLWQQQRVGQTLEGGLVKALQYPGCWIQATGRVPRGL
jgi:hypothetical protein